MLHTTDRVQSCSKVLSLVDGNHDVIEKRGSRNLRFAFDLDLRCCRLVTDNFLFNIMNVDRERFYAWREPLQFRLSCCLNLLHDFSVTLLVVGAR